MRLDGGMEIGYGKVKQVFEKDKLSYKMVYNGGESELHLTISKSKPGVVIINQFHKPIKSLEKRIGLAFDIMGQKEFDCETYYIIEDLEHLKNIRSILDKAIKDLE